MLLNKSAHLEPGKFHLCVASHYRLVKSYPLYYKKSSLSFIFQVQVHVEDDPERLYKQTEVSGEKKVTRGVNHVGNERKRG